MRITATVRTKNEEKNLRRFVESYQWADNVLIMDDFSDDETYLNEVVSEFENAQWKQFPGKRVAKEGITRAPHGNHINALFDWAEEIGTDWIIFDDCDCFPNKLFRSSAREIIEACKQDFIYLVRIYLYKDKGYFPYMSKPAGEWEASAYAFRANQGFRFSVDESLPYIQTFVRPDESYVLRLMPPYCLIHCPWPDDEAIAIKRDRYSRTYGERYSRFDPLNFAGELDNLEVWMD